MAWLFYIQCPLFLTLYLTKLSICTVHRRRHASNVLPLPVSLRWSPLASPFSQAFSEHCETTGMDWCITQYACLLPQLSPGTHSSLTTDFPWPKIMQIHNFSALIQHSCRLSATENRLLAESFASCLRFNAQRITGFTLMTMVNKLSNSYKNSTTFNDLCYFTSLENGITKFHDTLYICRCIYVLKFHAVFISHEALIN